VSVESEERFTFSSGDLTLEGAFRAPEDALRAAIVLHPHPQFGGDMDNHVVLALCRALAAGGAATLRFNFRGTGASEGTYDRGEGEMHDAAAALGVLRGRAPGLPVVLVGYSFGAQVAASIGASGEPLDALIVVSAPLAYAPLATPPSGLRVLAVAGDADPVCPGEALDDLRSHGADVIVVPGADHGWSEGTAELEAAVRSFLN
jgi:alpha/beta superfamily hydrolase